MNFYLLIPMIGMIYTYTLAVPSQDANTDTTNDILLDISHSLHVIVFLMAAFGVFAFLRTIGSPHIYSG